MTILSWSQPIFVRFTNFAAKLGRLPRIIYTDPLACIMKANLKPERSQ